MWARIELRQIYLTRSKMIYKICNFCWEEFKAKKNACKFCSKVCSSNSQKWKKRKPHTEEFKKAVSLRHKGKIYWAETRKKMRESKLGEKNPMKWKENKYLSKMSAENKWKKSPSWRGGLPKCLECSKKLTNYKTVRCMDCVGKFRSWEKSWNWKWWVSRINKTERQLAMETKEYKLWRHSVFERDNYTCIWCFDRWWILHADHIKPWCDYPEIRYAIDNWRTLCYECHKKTSTWWRSSQKIN